MRVQVGTSGFSYKEWKGSFYPAKIKPAEMLPYYATRLHTVEINNTFYRLPAAAVLAGWAAEVPEGFRFAVKASRRITHIGRLKNAVEPTEALFRTCAELGAKLGPILFGLPPNMKKDLGRLTDFLAAIPRGPRLAFEFRNASWFSDDVYAALRAHGAALCVAEGGDDDEHSLDVPLVATADFGYLRLRKVNYRSAEVAAWADRIRAQPWGEAFVYFKHEDGATGPRLAAELGALLSQ